MRTEADLHSSPSSTEISQSGFRISRRYLRCAWRTALRIRHRRNIRRRAVLPQRIRALDVRAGSHRQRSSCGRRDRRADWRAAGGLVWPAKAADRDRDHFCRWVRSSAHWPRPPMILAVGRIIVGFGIGLSSSGVPVYISEVAPADARGWQVSLFQLAITVGILLAYLVDYAFAGIQGWRWMFGLAIIPAAIFGSGMIFLPESPRWLLRRGRSRNRPRHAGAHSRDRGRRGGVPGNRAVRHQSAGERPLFRSVYARRFGPRSSSELGWRSSSKLPASIPSSTTRRSLFRPREFRPLPARFLQPRASARSTCS